MNAGRPSTHRACCRVVVFRIGTARDNRKNSTEPGQCPGSVVAFPLVILADRVGQDRLSPTVATGSAESGGVTGSASTCGVGGVVRCGFRAGTGSSRRLPSAPFE